MQSKGRRSEKQTGFIRGSGEELTSDCWLGEWGLWQGGFARDFWVIPGGHDTARQAKDGEQALARCEWLCQARRSQDEAPLRDARDGFFESVPGDHEDTTRLS